MSDYAASAPLAGDVHDRNRQGHRTEGACDEAWFFYRIGNPRQHHQEANADENRQRFGDHNQQPVTNREM